MIARLLTLLLRRPPAPTLTAWEREELQRAADERAVSRWIGGVGPRGGTRWIRARWRD